MATRAYETGTARTISGALLHVANSLGLEMDVDTINALESAYWTPRAKILISPRATVSQRWKCCRR
ncbi:hypothetical protein ECZU27_02220 [Escherichia coli]|nr:hypothetical protein ECZU27_02220 [Escherichia coli]